MEQPSNAELAVTDAVEATRYEGRIAEQLAGFIDYGWAGPVLVLKYARVLPEFGGRGVGGALVRQALDDVRARGLLMQPACSFVASWVDKHPEYADLVAPQAGDRPAPE
ncbi:GNAT family N-acetyltransferase [Actinoalloteichus hymeniacidonis]|uniref:Acetyltransferase n=1 Tax=Actinoalloteichus hymeniacidonis TaxID=340345 RepID=A0AAC9HTC4_9PSEU|nr:GNAT family N-acetyltransferase [Actinoalloteichus hymeniacidonis]AOS65242.1 putative acetyltransferase [Actinoalloteichus hymeniacidonis]MBB5906677.1 hypothetical protein [Actinoalloteichus hymeniacidonis]